MIKRVTDQKSQTKIDNDNKNSTHTEGELVSGESKNQPEAYKINKKGFIETEGEVEELLPGLKLQN